MIELLGVLRRPQTNTDLPPALRARLSHHEGGPFSGSADLPLVRFATVTPWGDRYFLVPLNPPTAETLAAAARRLKLSQAFLSSQTARILSTGEQILLMSPSGDGDCCFTTTAIKTGHDLHTTEVSGPRGYSATRAVAVIPDGVTKVGIDIPAQKLRRSPNAPPNSQANITQPAHLLLAVHNNVITFEIHQGGAGCCLTATMTWYGSEGQIVKRIRVP